jgi:putative flippase GtrA
MIVLIPAYEPDDRLTALLAQLRREAPHCRVVVVDDGSGDAYFHVFDAARHAGAEVLTLPVNAGKGRALKTGFQHIREHWPDADVVCADSDGQHRVADILRVGERIVRLDQAIVLGGRRFTGCVPARSRFGNAVSRQAFRLASGRRVHDTQTGLRGYPAGLLPWLLQVPGDRFEYELHMLLDSRAAGHPIDEIAIETVYLEGNESSHFRPIVDSVRVMLPLLAYAAASLSSFVVDFVALQLIALATGSLLISVVGARLLSGSLNFALNRSLVFGGASGPSSTLGRQALRYGALALGLLGASYGMLSVLTALGLALVPAKLITDIALYFVSYQVQRRLVFAGRGSGGEVERAREAVEQGWPPAQHLDGAGLDGSFRGECSRDEPVDGRPGREREVDGALAARHVES